MKKNESSSINRQNTGEDVNEGAKSKRNTAGKTQGKGTGMSSEAGAEQTEESWQGTGGSSAGKEQKKI